MFAMISIALLVAGAIAAAGVILDSVLRWLSAFAGLKSIMRSGSAAGSATIGQRPSLLQGGHAGPGRGAWQRSVAQPVFSRAA